MRDILKGYCEYKVHLSEAKYDSKFLINYLSINNKSQFLVVGTICDELIGAVTAKQALKVPKKSSDRTKVEEIMVSDKPD